MTTATDNGKALATAQPKNITHILAEHYGMEAADFYQTVVDTCFPGKPTKSQWTAFAMLAHSYGLNPIKKQIFAFPAKGGGIQPIVGVDGWLKIINEQPTFDGMEFEYHEADGKLEAITCIIHHKDRRFPTRVTEFMSECAQNSPPWQKSPRRQLRHKAIIQCGRVAYSLSGIMDEEEGLEAARSVSRELTVEAAVKTTDDLAARLEARTSDIPDAEEVQPERAHLDFDDGSPEGAFAGYGQ